MNLDFSNLKVLLLGDFMVDYYIKGISTRMSPEAPVPIIQPIEEYFVPGGAGNVAMNLSSLGAQVTCAGFLGNDIWGKKLLSKLQGYNISTEFIDVLKEHQTTVKKRVYLDGKQILRIDNELYHKWDNNNNINFKEFDVVIISDYNKGAVTNLNISAKLILVDPKKDNFSVYKNSTIVTPNLVELQKASKIKIEDDKSIISACKKLIHDNNFKYIVSKKGKDGMIVVGKDNFVKAVTPYHVKKPDVTGAGDTVIAVLSLVYSITKDIELAAKIANFAASIVVSKPATASICIEDIISYKDD